ncbi:minor tail protein [Mycobacterium phage Phabba]|uniref:Uncharacterized protein n=1 Tax=Mycobacterium phage Phabba TaxID=2027899 RepID=A0A249XSS5_9CAUD|nr:minor tail protein [Mycobacterium phage Phabba]ASZ74789.1 hypothetical protein SEA_PHABBA_252 [Mycobacterium phage Phabba]
MAGLTYVGADDTDPRSIETRLSAEGTLNQGVSRAYVSGRIAEKMATRAPKTYVDNADEQFSPVAYYSQQDALLVPNSAKGVASGVATLSNGKVPLAQIPVLGAGMLRGPWGANQSFGGTTGVTPLKIAQWNLGVTGVTGIPLVFMSTSVQSTDGRSAIEVRIGDNTQTTYAAQTLIAQGFGRQWYQDYQMITVIPCPPSGFALNPATNYIVNAWLIDTDGGQSTTQVGSIASASLFAARTAL